MKVNWKLVGLLATIASAGLSLITSKVDDKKMNETIEEKVREALSDMKDKGES